MTYDKLAVSQEARSMLASIIAEWDRRREVLNMQPGFRAAFIAEQAARFEAQARLAGERAGMERAAGIAADESIILSESRRPGSHGETRASHGKLIAMLIHKEAAAIRAQGDSHE